MPFFYKHLTKGDNRMNDLTLPMQPNQDNGLTKPFILIFGNDCTK